MVDVSDPAHPQQIGIFESETEVGVYVSGTSAYIAGGDSGLDYYRFRIIDVSDPTHPFQKGYCCHGTRPYSVYVCDSLAYVADYMFGLQVIRISHPPMLDVIGSYQTDSFVQSTFCADEYVYMGGPEGLYVLKYHQQVGISDDWVTTEPMVYALSQNYPNPFNPVTEITFELPEQADVRLTVYNILGQVVEVLVDANLPSGRQPVKWDGGSTASGIYFYRLEANDFSSTKRMVLMK